MSVAAVKVLNCEKIIDPEHNIHTGNYCNCYKLLHVHDYEDTIDDSSEALSVAP